MSEIFSKKQRHCEPRSHRERKLERGGEGGKTGEVAGMRFNNKSHPFAAVFPSLLLNYMLLHGPPYLCA